MSNDQHNQPNPEEEGADQSRVEKLVSLEVQREFDLFTGQKSDRIFLKLYVAARTSGLLAAISDRDWKTLCTLATYMDADGYCFPSQAELARAMGCSRQMANDRIKSLANFQFQGKAVVLVERENRTGQGTWGRNGYKILPLASIGIFDGPVSNQSDGRKEYVPKWVQSEDDSAISNTVSRELDTVENTPTMSSQTGTVELDTNKNQGRNKNQTSNIRKASPSQIEWEEDAPKQDHSREMTEYYDEDRQLIIEFMSDFGRELGDKAPLKSSTTRAYRLFLRSGLTREQFIEAMYQARAVTKERSASIRGTGASENTNHPKNRIAYWFACLESLLEDWQDHTSRTS